MRAACDWISEHIDDTMRDADDVYESDGYRLVVQSAHTLRGRDAVLAQVCDGILFGLKDCGGVRDIPPEHPVAVLAACYFGALDSRISFKVVRSLQILSPTLERRFAESISLMRGPSALPETRMSGNLRVPHTAAGFTVCFRRTANQEYRHYLDVYEVLQREVASSGHILMHTSWQPLPSATGETVAMVCMVRSSGWHAGPHALGPYFIEGQSATDLFVPNADCVLPRCIVRYSATARKRPARHR
tara:strand:+ start:738 stop:1472 length:735 start_codon:yes stop_codon:yes gene_type:complete